MGRWRPWPSGSGPGPRKLKAEGTCRDGRDISRHSGQGTRGDGGPALTPPECSLYTCGRHHAPIPHTRAALPHASTHLIYRLLLCFSSPWTRPLPITNTCASPSSWRQHNIPFQVAVLQFYPVPTAFEFPASDLKGDAPRLTLASLSNTKGDVSDKPNV